MVSAQGKKFPPNMLLKFKFRGYFAKLNASFGKFVAGIKIGLGGLKYFDIFTPIWGRCKMNPF